MRPAKKRGPTLLLSTVAAVGFAYALVVTVAMHFLRPDLSPVSSPISEYAVGPDGFLFATALFLWGAAALVLAAGIRRGVGPPGPSRIGLALLGVFGVGLIVASFFPMDVPFPPKDFSPGSVTASGVTHVLSATVATFVFPIAALLLSRGFAKDVNGRPFRLPEQALALASAAAVVALFVTSAVDIHFFGIAQRVVAALVLAWQLLAAIGLSRAHATESPAGAT
jgi:hypothetical protein